MAVKVKCWTCYVLSLSVINFCYIVTDQRPRQHPLLVLHAFEQNFVRRSGYALACSDSCSGKRARTDGSGSSPSLDVFIVVFVFLSGLPSLACWIVSFFLLVLCFHFLIMGEAICQDACSRYLQSLCDLIKINSRFRFSQLYSNLIWDD